jgi:hypothetical protein
MRPPRFHHDILHQHDSGVIHSIETDANNAIEDFPQEVQAVNLDSPIEATIAMESQAFEMNRVQTIDYLRKWGRLRRVDYNWEGVVIILNKISSDYLRYKEMVDDGTGRCFHLKCDAIRKALDEVASEVRKDKKIRQRSEWKMDMIYRCIGKLTLHGYDHSEDENTRRSIRNCVAVENALRSHSETGDWRVMDELDERLRFWRRIYFAVPHCCCLQCTEETRGTLFQGPR